MRVCPVSSTGRRIWSRLASRLATVPTVAGVRAVFAMRGTHVGLSCDGEILAKVGRSIAGVPCGRAPVTEYRRVHALGPANVQASLIEAGYMSMSPHEGWAKSRTSVQ